MFSNHLLHLKPKSTKSINWTMLRCPSNNFRNIWNAFIEQASCCTLAKQSPNKKNGILNSIDFHAGMRQWLVSFCCHTIGNNHKERVFDSHVFCKHLILRNAIGQEYVKKGDQIIRSYYRFLIKMCLFCFCARAHAHAHMSLSYLLVITFERFYLLKCVWTRGNAIKKKALCDSRGECAFCWCCDCDVITLNRCMHIFLVGREQKLQCERIFFGDSNYVIYKKMYRVKQQKQQKNMHKYTQFRHRKCKYWKRMCLWCNFPIKPLHFCSFFFAVC